MKKINRSIAIAGLAVAAIGASAVPASATTGGLVCNMSSSKHTLYVSSTRPASNPRAVAPGQCSTHVGVSNVQGFFSGWNMQSVWIRSDGSVYYGYVYSGGSWHYMSKDGVRLSLKVS